MKRLAKLLFYAENRVSHSKHPYFYRFMIIFKTVTALRDHLAARRDEGRIIGFVPTMGALHAGHLSLLAAARADNAYTVCSIFVNPTQFNDPKDFEKYPVTTAADTSLLEDAGCDVLFLPSVKEIYPDGLPVAAQQYDLGYLETILDGKYRPGHFQGVCLVVHRLLNITEARLLYLGQKDYQQCMVINRLIELIGQTGNIELKICPTLREADGLAMSSRNTRLSPEERAIAPVIYTTLGFIREHITPGNLAALKKEAVARLVQQGFKPDYAEIAHAHTLEIVDDWDGHTPLVALIAAFLNEVRLIDNLVLEVDNSNLTN